MFTIPIHFYTRYILQQTSEAHIPTEISGSVIGIKTCISNHIQVKQWDVIIHLCPHFKGGQVGHE